MMLRKLATILISLISLASFNGLTANFSGKTIEWMIPFAANNQGISKWAQFYAPLLSNALPGNPEIIIKHISGKSAIAGVNFFDGHAKPNGLHILGTSGLNQFAYLLENPNIKYDYRDFNAVLGTPTGGVVYVPQSLGVSSAKELKKLQRVRLRYASQGITSSDLISLLAFEMMGLSVRILPGMKGRKAGLLALREGKTTIDSQTTDVFADEMMVDVKEGKVVPLFTWGVLDNEGRFQRDPSLPDLPHFVEAYEMMHGKTPAGLPFNVFKAFFIAGFSIQKMIFLPKRTPQYIIDIYTGAFERIINRPDFVQRGRQLLGDYPQLTGYEVGILKQQATAIDVVSKQWFKEWLKRKYNINL